THIAILVANVNEIHAGNCIVQCESLADNHMRFTVLRMRSLAMWLLRTCTPVRYPRVRFHLYNRGTRNAPWNPDTGYCSTLRRARRMRIVERERKRNHGTAGAIPPNRNGSCYSTTGLLAQRRHHRARWYGDLRLRNGGTFGEVRYRNQSARRHNRRQRKHIDLAHIQHSWNLHVPLHDPS